MINIRKKTDKNYIELITTLLETDNRDIALLIIKELEDKGFNTDELKELLNKVS